MGIRVMARNVLCITFSISIFCEINTQECQSPFGEYMKIDMSKYLDSIPIESQEALHDTLAVLMEVEYQDGILPALLKAIDSAEKTLELEFNDLPRAIDQMLNIGEYHKQAMQDTTGYQKICEAKAAMCCAGIAEELSVMMGEKIKDN